MGDANLMDNEPVAESSEQQSEPTSLVSDVVDAVTSGARAVRDAIANVPAVEIIGATLGTVAGAAARAAVEAAREAEPRREGDNGAAPNRLENMNQKLKDAAKDMLLEAKDTKKMPNPEAFTNLLSQASAQAIANGLRPDGTISAAALDQLKKHFEMAGELGGTNNQDRFMRQLTVALQNRDLYMLHQQGEPANGARDHRLVVTDRNGALVGDATFRARHRN